MCKNTDLLDNHSTSNKLSMINLIYREAGGQVSSQYQYRYRIKPT
jgi:hypothetical protein